MTQVTQDYILIVIINKAEAISDYLDPLMSFFLHSVIFFALSLISFGNITSHIIGTHHFFLELWFICITTGFSLCCAFRFW